MGTLLEAALCLVLAAVRIMTAAGYTSIMNDPLHKLIASVFPNMDGWSVAFGQCFLTEGQNTVFCEAR